MVVKFITRFSNNTNPKKSQPLFDAKSNSIFGTAYGNSIFVIVGQNGKILTGTDETGWNDRDSHVREDLSGTAFGNSLFTAVGTGNILYSSCDTASSSANMINDQPGILKLLPNMTNNLTNENKKVARNTSLRMISPNGEEVLHPGEKFLITWESNKNIENVKLEYSTDNGSTYLEIGDRIPNSGCYEKSPQISQIDTEGMASPTYYCSRNTQIPEEKFWNENKVLHHRNTEYKKKLNNPGNLCNLWTSFNSLSPGEDRMMRNCYEWEVPHHISANCLVRISEVKERKTPLHGLLYELNFKITGNKPLTNTGEIFSIYPGDAANQPINQSIPMISFSNESNNKTYIHWNETIKEISRLTGFLDRWHNIRIMIDNAYGRMSVILDGSMIFENIPGEEMAFFSPALSFSVGPDLAAEVEIDDVVVRALYSQEESIQGNTLSYPRPHALGPRPPLKFTTLFSEDFERLNEKNNLENKGWRTKSEQALGSQQKQTRKSVFVNLNPANASKTLKIQPVPGNRVIAVKHFNIPIDFPFDVSDKPFEIRYNNGMNSEAAAHEPVDIYPGYGGHGTSENYSYSAPSATFNNSNSTADRIQDTTLVDIYYIYTYDGKLLAEYDHNGNCVKDYIYAGNRLITEYYPPPIDKYYYYMPDQVNSVRIVTDDNGDVVYSAAYGPFGEVEKVETNTYEPKLKFSGKERDEYTDLDYFGARYYDHKHYRFNSVDPIINKGEALFNPQLWNLYSYCRNNPLTYLDPTGMDNINVFLGFDETVRAYFRPNVPGAPSSPLPFPNFKTISNDIHTVNMMPFSKKAFEASLKSKESWTFFIGDSAYDKEGCFYGMKFLDGEFHNLYLNNYIFSENEYVGIFACSSSEYALKLIYAEYLFSVMDGGNKYSFAHSLMNAAYNVMKTLANGGSAKDAALSGTNSLRDFGHSFDKNDSIIVD